MRTTSVLAALLCLSLALISPTLAGSGDVPTIIEGFLTKQFPGAKSHFWVVNTAQWQTTDEMIVDFNAIVTRQTGQTPEESRYLLLIVSGRLAGAQNIPLDATTDCRPEQA